MAGKKNIIFGFFYLLLTAALGPVMVIKHFGADGPIANAESAKQEKLGKLQQAVADNFEINLEPMKPVDIAKTNSHALLSLSSRLNAQAPVDAIKGGPHSHGNLEALLNIVIGLLLAFLVIPKAFKEVISWVFIAGALLHSGLLYLAIGLDMSWAGNLMVSWFGYLGPVLLLLGFILAGIATIIGFRGQLSNA
jgi:hypothetical protein